MPPELVGEDESVKPLGLTPLQVEDLGLYAPFELSPEDMYGPDELGVDMVSAIKSMVDGGCKYEDSARIWEVIQAAEARLFDRGYQWLTNGKDGGSWVIAGTGGNGGVGSGAIAQQDKSRMWAVNIYGARKDKIVAALTVKDPEPEFFAKVPESALDQQYSDEAGKYKHLWKQATNVRGLCVKVAGLFYTDDRVALITESIANAQAYGKEGGDPVVREVTRAYGKLEFRVPMSIDEEDGLPWCCRERELDLAIAKEKYSWIKNISAGAGGQGQIGRTCRLTVRNAVQNQTGFTSNAVDRAVTEATWWVQPSQYRDIADEGQRKTLREVCPDGMRIVFIGGELAYIRNEKMGDCVIILYSRDGTGQNRRAIGSNNLVTQKVLNYDYNLFNKYMTATVPRKMHNVNKLNSEAIAAGRMDVSGSIPVDAQAGEDINSFTGIETVPQPPAQLMEFIQFHVEGLPETMDGASPSMFGGTDGTDTVGGITIQRDQALQVFGTPYNAMTWGVAISCGNAAKWAGRNRQGSASGMVPGVGRISVDFSKMANGDAYCYPQADAGFPESEAEKDAQLKEFIDGGGVPTVMTACGDPMNYEAANRATKRFGITIPGTDSVRKQQEEFEVILKSAPQPNPALLQAQIQMQQSQMHAATDPQAQMESQSPEGQSAMQAAQQAIAQIPPMLCSVAVEQDASVNHAIEAAVCYNKINSPEGQKLKREQPPIFANLMLHWQGHSEMAAKLAPPPAAPIVKPGVTLAVDKLGAEAQAAVLQKEYGITVTPEQVQPSPDMHELVQEKEGVDENGVPTKQKLSYSGAALQ
jgi:hypothetical protein